MTEQSGKTILIVDDEQPVLDVLKRQVEQYGYVAVISDSGRNALEMLEEKDPRFSTLMAVLLDLHLKDISGFDVLKKIRELRPSLCVIMVTGSHDEKEARKAMELGAMDYITKPVDFDYLMNVLSLQDPN